MTKFQEIGIQLYDDLNQKMNRAEVEEISAVVKNAALSINPGFSVITTGSYRRESKTCGDVDVLITHPDGKSHVNALNAIVTKLLTETDFITYELASHEKPTSSTYPIYYCICKLGPNRIHRRLDILVVPFVSYGAALLQFTGNTYFNRSMKTWAKKHGMKLNMNGLYERIDDETDGDLIASRTEEEIFDALGIPYQEPVDRCP